MMKLNDKLVALYKKIKSNVKITLCHCTLRYFFFKGFNIFHLLYVNAQFIPISNRSHAKSPASP